MTSASYTSITGLTVLEKPRKTSAKGLVFDGFFYPGTESRESIMASLHYFNANGTDFPPVGVYFLYATAAQVDPRSTVDLFPDPKWHVQRKREDYALVGDVQFLHLIGTPDEVDFDMRQRAYVHLAGAAMNPNADTATWSMEADQYTATIRDIQKEAKDSGKVQPRSFFPATCTIPDSSRYTSSTKTKKPVPFNKHYVMVAGFLTNITSVLDATDSKIKDRFCHFRLWAFSWALGCSHPDPIHWPAQRACGTSGAALAQPVLAILHHTLGLFCRPWTAPPAPIHWPAQGACGMPGTVLAQLVLGILHPTLGPFCRAGAAQSLTLLGACSCACTASSGFLFHPATGWVLPH
ncbi:hypothetical protein DFH08DRAFT_801938 [Mycena albidolilacea]|uniref:Uncharacterized protein n=1 Tax=Mycena albidolilacea TaxID=1033008 RepID=A0AAD7EYE2_9AGAR|nr:hypothetical protein DFH08DRAFT_801938 [Mycena albidolilacea]